MSQEEAPSLQWRLLADVPPHLAQFNAKPYMERYGPITFQLERQ